MVPIAVLCLLGIYFAARRAARDAASTRFSVRADLAWPAERSAQTPFHRNTDRQDLETAGYEHVASIDVESDQGTELRAILIANDGKTLAITSSSHLQLMSDIAGRALVTSTRADRATAAREMAQFVPFGDAVATNRTHHEALAVAVAVGGVPSNFAADAAVTYVLDLEKSRLDHAARSNQFKRAMVALMWPFGVFGDRPLLTGNANSRARVEHWVSR